MSQPKPLSRRDVLQTATLLGVSLVATSGAAAEGPSAGFLSNDSGLVTGKMKPLKYEEIPPLVKNSILAIEDARFYEHIGIDPAKSSRGAAQLVASRSALNRFDHRSTAAGSPGR